MNPYRSVRVGPASLRLVARCASPTRTDRPGTPDADAPDIGSETLKMSHGTPTPPERAAGVLPLRAKTAAGSRLSDLARAVIDGSTPLDTPPPARRRTDQPDNAPGPSWSA